MNEVTSKKGTDTSEGFIQHLIHNGNRLPVKLDFSADKKDGLYPPLRLDGKLVYALPEGKTYIP